MKKQFSERKTSKPSQGEQYLYSIGWFEQDEVFVARVAEFPSLAAHGETQEEAMREIRDVVELVLNDLKESNEPIPEPFGKRSFS